MLVSIFSVCCWETLISIVFFFFSSRRRHTRFDCDWSSDVCSSDLCPLDSDKDGVPDGIDKCPNTPPGTEVDSTGCPRFKDSDGDGVPDDRDKCPGTPPGSRVDANGCVILFTPERTPVILRGVTFEPGRAVLQLESFTVLNIVAQSLVANPAIRIEIAGYTDGTGSAATNLRLSQARSLRVPSELQRQRSMARLISA